MPRPPKCRRVEQLPWVTYFKPSGIPMTELSEIVLSIEELEAIRLRDLSGLEHEECAERMSFHRVLASARQKVAQALVNGEALKVSGGNYKLAQHNLKCRSCGHHWEGTIHRRRTQCPSCCGKNWQRIEPINANRED